MTGTVILAYMGASQVVNVRQWREWHRDRTLVPSGPVVFTVLAAYESHWRLDGRGSCPQCASVTRAHSAIIADVVLRQPLPVTRQHLNKHQKEKMLTFLWGC